MAVSLNLQSPDVMPELNCSTPLTFSHFIHNLKPLSYGIVGINHSKEMFCIILHCVHANFFVGRQVGEQVGGWEGSR